MLCFDKRSGAPVPAPNGTWLADACGVLETATLRDLLGCSRAPPPRVVEQGVGGPWASGDVGLLHRQAAGSSIRGIIYHDMYDDLCKYPVMPVLCQFSDENPTH